MSNPVVLSVKTLAGYKVRNAADEDLGKIEELVVDDASGRIMYAVLSFGGFLGMGDRLCAIPWMSLNILPDQRVFILDADKETLRRAPAFDRRHWPNMSDRGWQENVEAYFILKSASGPAVSEREGAGQFRGSRGVPSEEFIESEVPSQSVEEGRDDERLARRVEFELYSTKAVDLENVKVSARDGIITLDGRISSRAEMMLAENTARTVDGVREVRNNLRVSKVA